MDEAQLRQIASTFVGLFASNQAVRERTFAAMQNPNTWDEETAAIINEYVQPQPPVTAADGPAIRNACNQDYRRLPASERTFDGHILNEVYPPYGFGSR